MPGTLANINKIRDGFYRTKGFAPEAETPDNDDSRYILLFVTKMSLISKLNILNF